MRNLVLALAAAGALAGAAMLSAPALAAPIGSLGALNAAAATLNDVEQAALVCNRWRCWHVCGRPRLLRASLARLGWAPTLALSAGLTRRAD